MVDIWMRDISPAGKMHDQTQFVYGKCLFGKTTYRIYLKQSLL